MIRKIFLANIIAAMCALSILMVGCAKKTVDDKTVQAEAAKNFTNSIGMEIVCLNKGYYVAKYETTQEQFNKIMGYNPSKHKDGKCPVESLTAGEAMEFCKKLTEKDAAAGILPKGYEYALPTFAQWLEYFAGDPLENAVTPYGGNPNWTNDRPLQVGCGEVNRLGLYDIRGNVSEFSQDLYSPAKGYVVLGASFNTHRKGFHDYPAVKAGFLSKEDKNPDVGFRCVLVPVVGGNNPIRAESQPKTGVDEAPKK